MGNMKLHKNKHFNTARQLQSAFGGIIFFDPQRNPLGGLWDPILQRRKLGFKILICSSKVTTKGVDQDLNPDL